MSITANTIIWHQAWAISYKYTEKRSKYRIHWYEIGNIGIFQDLESPIFATIISKLLPFHGEKVRVNRQIAVNV